jgi:thiol-disulfide isomerase/thioredoxin
VKLSNKTILFPLGLLIAAGVGYWGALQRTADTAASHPPPSPKLEALARGAVLNTARPLTGSDLQGRILVVNFCTLSSTSSLHAAADLMALEKEFGPVVTILGVHVPKFESEKDPSTLRALILRYGLTFPMIDDSDGQIAKLFGVTISPTWVVVNPQGEIVGTFPGEGHAAELALQLRALKGILKGESSLPPLPLALEQTKTPPKELSFPTHLVYAENVDGEPLLWISDSANHRVLGVRLSGTVAFEIGKKGEAGRNDGTFDNAHFHDPGGLLFREQTLYIADTSNHLIRKADLSTKRVSTIAGTGMLGSSRYVKDAPALTTPLSSPTDLAFYPSPQEITISMTGVHQLWTYHLDNLTLTTTAGSGTESMIDGIYPDSSLAEPSGLAALDHRLYFVDAASSSLRALENNAIQTLIGISVPVFGFNDGLKEQARMQHPTGLFADATGVYIADTYNHAIRKYDPTSATLTTVAGNGSRGELGPDLTSSRFNAPSAVTRGKTEFYVADTNNHAVIVVDLDTRTVKPFLIDEEDRPKPLALDKDLPNLKNGPRLRVKAAEPIELDLDLPSEWKINDTAPSALTLFKIHGTKGESVAHFSRDALIGRQVRLPAMEPNSLYRLQGTFYFCKDQKSADCSIQSHDQELAPSDNASQAKLDIHLLP